MQNDFILLDHWKDESISYFMHNRNRCNYLLISNNKCDGLKRALFQKYEMISYLWHSQCTNQFHTFLTQNGRKPFQNLVPRPISKRSTVLLIFHVPPRPKIQAIEVQNDFILLFLNKYDIVVTR